jgi:hypothetical protein
LEKAFLRMLCCVLPPARDNQRAADFLHEKVGANNRFLEWTAVRPDTLLPGDVSEYTLHEGLVNGLFAPGSTNMANVANFMCELVTNPKTWTDWKAKLPVIINAAASSVATSQPTQVAERTSRGDRPGPADQRSRSGGSGHPL